MARTGAIVALIVLAFLVASAASSCPTCCTDHRPWGSHDQMNGCSPDQNSDCNSWCATSCRGGECKLRGGHYKCHCYC